MRSLILISIIYHLTAISTHAQPITVEGSAGTAGNYTTQFDGQFFTVARSDGFAIIGLDGKTLAHGLKAPAIDFSQSVNIYHGALFTQDGAYLVLRNYKGELLGAGKYIDRVPFTTDNTAVRLPSPQGTWIVAYIDTAGKEIVQFDVKKYIALTPPQPTANRGFTVISLTSFLPFSEGLTPLQSPLGGKAGYIDKALKVVIPVSFTKARPFSNGLAAVQDANGIWGFIDRTGKLIIPYTYSLEPGRFQSGLAKVQNKQGRWGYINKQNTVVIQPIYEYGTNIYKGYALVREGFQQPTQLIDSTGAVIATFPKELLYIDRSKPDAGIFGGDRPEYPFHISETLQQLVDEGMAIFQKGDHYGVFDNKGKPVLECKYRYLADLHNGKMFAHFSEFINNKTVSEMGIIDTKGNWLVKIAPTGF